MPGRLGIAIALAVLLCAGPALGQGAQRPVWITLGTAGGPMPNPLRSQPANALVAGDDVVLFDVGDGAVERMAAAGLRLGQVRAVFLSHLHSDHVAGLAGLIGLRWMTSVRAPLTVYGPPGTRTLVEGLLASMEPTREAGYGFPNGFGADPIHIGVKEIAGGASVAVLPGMEVIAAENTHYSFTPGSDEARRFKSLSYRIQARGRVIVYTGDTGPSEAVTRLAKGADLLVSEAQNLPALVKVIHAASPNMPASVFDATLEHLRRHHLSTEDVGRMASAAGVGAVVLTHLGPAPPPAAADALFLPGVKANFHGPVTVAKDLDRF